MTFYVDVNELSFTIVLSLAYRTYMVGQFDRICIIVLRVRMQSNFNSWFTHSLQSCKV